MAETAEGTALTRQYQQAQLSERARLIHELSAQWSLLDPRNIDSSFARYSPGALALVQDSRLKLASAASNYYRLFRDAEGVGGTAPAVEFAPFDVVHALTSLLVTGPVALKRAISGGFTVEQGMKAAFVAQSGAASRLAINGGRDVVNRSVRADDRAHGFARVTTGRACAFCAMLASRGPVYKTAKRAGAEGHRYHDHCSCAVEPFFSATPTWNAQSAHYQDLWISATAGKSGKQALAAFRAALSQP